METSHGFCKKKVFNFSGTLTDKTGNTEFRQLLGMQTNLDR